MITMRQVEVFRTIMTTGSATQAAAVLGITQPAVSRIISDLEEEVEFKIFNRDNRQLKPTPEGEALYEQVKRAFIGLDHIANAAVEIRQHSSGYLKLILIPVLMNSIFIDALQAFSNRFPNVMMSVEVEGSNRIVDWVSSRQADLGFITTPIHSSIVHPEVLWRGHAVALVHESSPLARKDVITPQDLSDAQFISYKSDTLFRHKVDETFRAAKVLRNMRIEVRSTEGAYALVGAGLGVSVVQAGFPNRQRFDGVCIRPFKPALETELIALYSSETQPSMLAQEFLQIMREKIAQTR